MAGHHVSRARTGIEMRTLVTVGELLAIAAVFAILFLGVDPGEIGPSEAEGELSKLKAEVDSVCRHGRTVRKDIGPFTFDALDSIRIEDGRYVGEVAGEDKTAVRPFGDCDSVVICTQRAGEAGCSPGGEIGGGEVGVQVFHQDGRAQLKQKPEGS